MAEVAVLGTGLLGSGMVENLLRKGHGVRVWNRSPGKLEALRALGAAPAADPAAAVRGAERVHLVLTADDAVDAVVSKLRPGLSDGVPVVDHSTNLPKRTAARARQLRQDGVRYLPAPVFMSPDNAREASGMMLLAGPGDDARAVEPALAEMTGKLWYVGERDELASFYKLAGNGLLIAICGTMGDLLAMGAENGCSADEVLALFQTWKPGAAIPFFGQRVATAGEFPVSFALEMARKDVRLMCEAAGSQPLAVLPAIGAAMDRAVAEGHGGQDFAIFARPDRG